MIQNSSDFFSNKMSVYEMIPKTLKKYKSINFNYLEQMAADMELDPLKMCKVQKLWVCILS